MAHLQEHNCNCSLPHSSTRQTIDELDFERGIWTAALNSDVNALKKHIRKGHVNAKDNSGYTGEHNIFGNFYHFDSNFENYYFFSSSLCFAGWQPKNM